MNTQEYISSGIVEAYVLGLADPAERTEFERMCAQFPEVREAREAFEVSLEEYAVLNQVEPPRNLKSKVLSAIDMEAGQSVVDPEPDVAREPGRVETDRPWIAREPRRAAASNTWQTYLATAAVILLLFSTGLNFYFFNRSQQYNEAYQELLARQAELVSNNQLLQTRLLEYERAVEWMKDPNMAIVKMPAMPNSPDPKSATTVYWDTVSKDVYLAVNQLPPPAADQQYQLWAMVDGTPVDAGVFDMNGGAGVVKMKNIPRAQAFAITLEKKGGSPTPSLDKLYVMGKV